MLRGLGPDLTAGGRRSEVACAIFYSEILGSKKEGARFAGGAEVEVGAAGEQSGAGGFAAAAGGAGRQRRGSGKKEPVPECPLRVGQMRPSLVSPLLGKHMAVGRRQGEGDNWCPLYASSHDEAVGLQRN